MLSEDISATKERRVMVPATVVMVGLVHLGNCVLWCVGTSLLKANKPQTVLFKVPTPSLLPASHGGLVHAVTRDSKHWGECSTT